jgi:transcriptional regulator with GAF, ATPase, and Fis domain
VDDAASLDIPTWITPHQGQARSVNIRRCRLSVVAGPDAGRRVELAQPSIVIGRTGGDLVLTDPKVSALHAALELAPDGYRVRDLDSSNGTFVGGVRVLDGFVAPGATLTLGKSAVVFEPLDESVAIPLWSAPRLAGLVGGSVVMRHLYELINRFAASDATVLIQGETGSGKELVAEAIHRCSPRAGGPFHILDCSAIPEQLFEDQLFGHDAGAFTGAVRAVPGALEIAHGGTLFLDEIGELPLAIQAKLLRAVETRKVQRLGGSRPIACNVRIVAATNRDLAGEVNRGTFRADLYYRIAVAQLAVPPLRHRREDIPMLVAHFLREHDPTGSAALGDDFLNRASRHNWPGNVRELRNAVQRALLAPASATEPPPPSMLGRVDLSVPFKVAKQQLIDEFDRTYMTELLAAHDHNLTAAARATGVERMTIYKMIRRLGLDRDGAPATPWDDDPA